VSLLLYDPPVVKVGQQEEWSATVDDALPTGVCTGRTFSLFSLYFHLSSAYSIKPEKDFYMSISSIEGHLQFTEAAAGNLYILVS